MRRTIGRAIMLMALAGCATGEAGRKFDTAAVASIKVGVTTEAQARATFGVPYNEEHGSNGHTRLTYLHVATRANGFTGRVDTSTDRLVMVFGADGKLLSYSSSGSPAAGL